MTALALVAFVWCAASLAAAALWALWRAPARAFDRHVADALAIADPRPIGPDDDPAFLAGL